jgi:hypothetical protein
MVHPSGDVHPGDVEFGTLYELGMVEPTAMIQLYWSFQTALRRHQVPPHSWPALLLTSPRPTGPGEAWLIAGRDRIVCVRSRTSEDRNTLEVMVLNPEEFTSAPNFPRAYDTDSDGPSIIRLGTEHEPPQKEPISIEAAQGLLLQRLEKASEALRTKTAVAQNGDDSMPIDEFWVVQDGELVELQSVGEAVARAPGVKERLGAKLREQLDELRFQAAILIAESWAVLPPKDPAKLAAFAATVHPNSPGYVPPSQHPDRTTILMGSLYLPDRILVYTYHPESREALQEPSVITADSLSAGRLVEGFFPSHDNAEQAARNSGQRPPGSSRRG